MRILIAIISLFFLVSCSDKPAIKVEQTKDTVLAKSIDTTEPLYRDCFFSNKDFAYAIDSCNCGDIQTTSDTIFIDLFPAWGGEIQDRFLHVHYPVCDSSFYILRKHQNRYYVSSMGPDPVLNDWILYESAFDTIFFDQAHNGFFIDALTQEEQEDFPKFDTLDFYKAYTSAVGENLNLDYVPDNAKGALYREYENNKENTREILNTASVELHRMILVLRKANSTRKVMVFNYGHFG